MTDKEVGELWADNNLYEHNQAIEALIRKLVEERAEVIGCLHKEGYRDVPMREDRRGWIPYKTVALSDFGIDEKDFNNEKAKTQT